MKKKTRKRPAAKTSKKPRTLTAKQAQVQEALQVTWLLKGKLKSAQMAYLRIGELLVRVRDKKLYAELKHADIEEYARERLQLGRSSLFHYIQAYDWVSKSHPEWLRPKPKGYIPDMSDISDLIWIENELARKDLSESTRTALTVFQKKALAGGLRQSDLDPFRGRQKNNKAVIKTCLTKLRSVRRYFAQLKNLPADVITHLDAAITILNNDKT